MKKLIITIVIFTTAVAGAFAGPETYNDSKAVQPVTYQPSQELFRNQEWNLDLFGSYAYAARPWRSDRYLGTDHAWGGGLDANYIFHRYFGLGLEGYALAADDVIGEASGNLILRYPIPGTMFAPYAFAGGGVVFNGSRVENLVENGNSIGSIRRHSNTEGLGQIGAGFEVRFTPHIGLINDFSWNIVDGPQNNFGMVRSGLRFAF